MNNSYLDDAGHFFSTTELEMDPDAAIFFRFHQDSAFWLWLGDHLQSLVGLAQHGGEDNDARARIDRFLHGAIACDQLLGGNGVVLKSLVQILRHSPAVLEGVLKEPVPNLSHCLSDTGPYSCLTSIRFVHYAKVVLAPADYAAFVLTLGLTNPSLDAIRFSALMAGDDNEQGPLAFAVDTKRRGVFWGILHAVNQSSLVTESELSAAEMFPEKRVKAHCGAEGLQWPEWQLLPLLVGGVEHAASLGISLETVSMQDPLDAPANNVWHLFFNQNHVADCESLRGYLERSVITLREPKELIAAIVTKDTGGLSPSIMPWVCQYLQDHKTQFHATPMESRYKLNRFLKIGVDKRTVMTHPEYNNQLKGSLLSDELGL